MLPTVACGWGSDLVFDDQTKDSGQQVAHSDLKTTIIYKHSDVTLDSNRRSIRKERNNGRVSQRWSQDKEDPKSQNIRAEIVAVALLKTGSFLISCPLTCIKSKTKKNLIPTAGCYLSEGQGGAECVLHQLGHLPLKLLHVLALVGPSMMQKQLGNSLTLKKRQSQDSLGEWIIIIIY